MKQLLAIAIALLSAQPWFVQAASPVAEGKDLYSQFRCADCHGDDGKTAALTNAKTGAKTKVPQIAGMNPDDLFIKTKKFIESNSHEQVLQGCGEPPSHMQIKKISDYLATLPK